MLAHLGFQRPFQHRFGELLEQPVLPDDILGFLVVSEQLIDQLLVDCHGPFILLSPMAIYTVLFTPSRKRNRQMSISKTHPMDRVHNTLPTSSSAWCCPRPDRNP